MVSIPIKDINTILVAAIKYWAVNEDEVNLKAAKTVQEWVRVNG